MSAHPQHPLRALAGNSSLLRPVHDAEMIGVSLQPAAYELVADQPSPPQVTAPGSRTTIVPYEPYAVTKKQYGVAFRKTVHFAIEGRPGILLQEAMYMRFAGLDNPDEVVFKGPATKVTHVIDVRFIDGACA